MSTRSPLIVLGEMRAFSDSIDQAICNGCDACGARCTDGVPLLEPEYAAIRAFLASPAGAEARRVELEEKRLPYPGTEREDGVFYTACRFRDTERGRCSIYPVRPTVCRMFGHVEWLPCPIEAVPSVAPGALAAMRGYGEAPQKSYEAWLANDPST